MPGSLRVVKILASTALLTAMHFVQAEAPTISPIDDARNLGHPEKVRSWTPEQKVASFRNIDKIWSVRTVNAGDSPFPLPSKTVELGQVIVATNDQKMTLDEYFVKQNVAGLLVIKDGRILYERYGLGNTKASHWISWSVAKSVVSMLIGAAINDGHIASLDEMVTDYLPRLKGSPYDQSSIRTILQMSSGIRWNEDYADPNSDINRVPWSALDMHQYMKTLPREHKPGETFHYNTAESRIVGNVLRAAIGNNLSTYLSEKIWKPFGMESDANWALTNDGGESGGCCISATLRDYARIGMFALNEGRLMDGTRVLPKNWMRESTTPSKAWKGYGYLWWLQPGNVYQATGIHGQGIRVNPEERVVIALHSARAVASKSADWDLQDAMFNALTEAVSN